MIVIRDKKNEIKNELEKRCPLLKWAITEELSSYCSNYTITGNVKINEEEIFVSVTIPIEQYDSYGENAIEIIVLGLTYNLAHNILNYKNDT